MGSNPNDEAPTVDEDAGTETEVVEEHNPALTADVEALATFSVQEGPLSFRILPIMEQGQTDWRVNVYMSGVQGPVYQSRDGITDDAVAKFGISSILQGRMNDALQYAQDNLEVPPELGNKVREKRPLEDLEGIMEE